MTCPNCQAEDSAVLDSRRSVDGIKRTRKCNGCGTRWTTVEIEAERLSIFKRQALLFGQLRMKVAEFSVAMGWKDQVVT